MTGKLFYEPAPLFGVPKSLFHGLKRNYGFRLARSSGVWNSDQFEGRRPRVSLLGNMITHLQVISLLYFVCFQNIYYC